MTPTDPITDDELATVRAAMEKALEAIQYHKDCADEVSWEAVRTAGTEFCKTVSPATLARILARLNEAEIALTNERAAALSGRFKTRIAGLEEAEKKGRREGLQRAEEITRQWLSEICYGANDYDHGLEDAAKQIADAIAKEAEK